MKYLLLAGSVIASVLAQTAIKLSSGQPVLGPRWIGFMGAGAILYAGSFFAYAYLLRSFELSRLGPVMAAAVAVLVAAAGVAFFGEPFTLRKAAGIACAAAALVLLAR